MMDWLFSKFGLIVACTILILSLSGIFISMNRAAIRSELQERADELASWVNSAIPLPSEARWEYQLDLEIGGGSDIRTRLLPDMVVLEWRGTRVHSDIIVPVHLWDPAGVDLTNNSEIVWLDEQFSELQVHRTIILEHVLVHQKWGEVYLTFLHSP